MKILADLQYFLINLSNIQLVFSSTLFYHPVFLNYLRRVILTIILLKAIFFQKKLHKLNIDYTFIFQVW